MSAGIGWVWIVAVGVQAPSPADHQNVRLRLLRPDGSPAAGALVRWWADREIWTYRNHDHVPERPAEWFEAKSRTGPTFTADAAGRVEIPAQGSPGGLEAESGGLFGRKYVLGPASFVESWTLQQDRTLQIRTLDKAGSTQPGVFVEVRRPNGFTAWWDPSGPDGIASIPHAQDELFSRAEGPLVVALAFPALVPTTVRLDESRWPSEPLDLELPPTGRLVVTLPATPESEVRIRRVAPRDSETGPRVLWFEPPSLRAPNGRAVFPHVGLGLNLNVSANWSGASDAVLLEIAGPKNAGDEVAVDFAKLADAMPRVTARVLDVDGRVLPSTDVALGMDTWQRNGGPITKTDEEGRFHIAIAQPWSSGQSRTMRVSKDSDDIVFGNELIAPFAEIDLSRELAAGLTDLGDLRLVAEVPTARTTEAEIEAKLQRWAHASDVQWRLPEKVDRLLSEVVRRGDPQWVEVLEGVLKELPSRGSANRPSMPTLRLQVLTALRRLQGKPDPLQIEVAEQDVLQELIFPELPVFHVTLVNADVDRATFDIQEGGDYRSGRFARWRIEGVDALGVPLERIDLRGIGGGMHGRVELEPRETWSWALPFEHYVRPSPSGEWRLRILYNDFVTIANEESVDGLMCASSRELVVRWKPRRLTLPGDVRRTIERHLAAIDVQAPIVFTDAFAVRGGTHLMEQEAPAQAIFAAGLDAVPVLMDAILTPELDPMRRAWAFALLYDITGINDPRSHRLVIGRWEAIQAPKGTGTRGVFLGGASRGDEGGPSARAQEEFAARWRDLAPMLVVD